MDVMFVQPTSFSFGLLLSLAATAMSEQISKLLGQ